MQLKWGRGGGGSMPVSYFLWRLSNIDNFSFLLPKWIVGKIFRSASENDHEFPFLSNIELYKRSLTSFLR